MQDFDIIFYDKPDGTEPVKEFLDSLDVKMRAKMIRTIVILQKNGYELREPYSKMLNEGILELRAKVGSDISRVLYFFIVGKKSSADKWLYQKKHKKRQKKNWNVRNNIGQSI
ncbi:MAG: type II toxin-antitoxin system RelE/ParE family toxin [Ruminococcus callidus]